MFDGETGAPQGGLTGIVRRLLESLLGFFKDKFELLNVEILEEKRRILELLILAATAMLFSTMALMVLTLIVVVYYWDSDQRMVVLTVMCAFYVVVAAALFIRLRSRASLRTKVFETTVEELKNDSEWIRRHLPHAGSSDDR